jgi:hypothetical protein
MALSEEQLHRAQQYFNVNGVVADCPYCSTHGWEGGEIISAAVVDERGEAGGSEVVAMVQFTCRNCGHITLFDARRMGLFGG